MSAPAVTTDLAAVAGTVHEWLATSGHVLIGAGAGLSVAAGIDYTDRVSFARDFPDLVRRGMSACYQLIGRRLPPEVHWSYWARHVLDARFSDRRSAVYEQLHDLVADKDVFVMTSNVDALFARHGFDEARVFTPQGDFALMQCRAMGSAACRDATWPSRPILERIVAAIDPATGEVADPTVIPACPRCGGAVFLNVRESADFVEAPYHEGAHRLSAWLESAMREPLLVLEIGAGFNTPGVIRFPLENVVYHAHGARFVRVNPEHPAVPEEIADRSLAVRAGAAETVDTIARHA
jgi:NAD-dependent SIR2 family protein deacetylase